MTLSSSLLVADPASGLLAGWLEPGRVSGIMQAVSFVHTGLSIVEGSAR